MKENAKEKQNSTSYIYMHTSTSTLPPPLLSAIWRTVFSTYGATAAPRGNLHFNRQGTVSEPKYALRRTAGKRTQLHMFPMNPPRQFRGPGRKGIFLAAGSLPSAAISYRRYARQHTANTKGSIKEDPVARN